MQPPLRVSTVASSSLILRTTDVAVHAEERALTRWVDELLEHARGDRSEVLLCVLAPAARHLEREWHAGRRSLADVLIGHAGLRQMLVLLRGDP